MTKYDVHVVDILKPHANLHDHGGLNITRAGGRHTESGRVVRSAVVGFEDFERKGEYLLFLTWNTVRNEFDIAYGPNGSYQWTAEGTVRPLGRSPMATSQKDKGWQAFLQELRIAAAR